MRKLRLPTVDFATAFSSAVSGVGDATLSAQYSLNMPNRATLELNYIAAAKAANLYSMNRLVATRGSDPVVAGTLRKSHLSKLYTQYFVAEKKPARNFYNKILVTANGKCPFCGDVGQVKNLDHYLPKANFPIYSVLPVNLIPCCRDCNSEKLNAFSTTQGGQSLNPYFDDDKFFDEKWIGARVVAGAPPIMEFFVLAPIHWTAVDQARVKAHFDDYSLASRFGVEAGVEISEAIQTRRTTLAGHSPAEYAAHLKEASDLSPALINNWRRVMYAALAADAWFCSHPH